MKNKAIAAEKAWLKAAAKEIRNIKKRGLIYCNTYDRFHVTDILDGYDFVSYFYQGPYSDKYEYESYHNVVEEVDGKKVWKRDQDGNIVRKLCKHINLYSAYRYRHVAYSLLRGHTMQEIEPKNHKDHGLNQALLDECFQRLKKAAEEARDPQVGEAANA